MTCNLKMKINFSCLKKTAEVSISNITSTQKNLENRLCENIVFVALMYL